MANRVIQAKVIKERKRIRRLPKPYRAEYVHVGSVPNPDVLADTSARARSQTMFMRQTTSAKEAEERARMAYLEAMFPSYFGLSDNIPRKEVKRRVYDMLADVPLERHVVLTQTKYYKLMMYFNDKDRTFLVSVDLLKRCVSKSINYGSRDRAKDVLRRRCVMWKKPIYFDPPLPPSSG